MTCFYSGLIWTGAACYLRSCLRG